MLTVTAAPLARVVNALLYRAGLLAFVLVLIFLLFSALPSDPARLMLGINASEEAVVLLRRELGLDQSLFQQFSTYVSNLAKLELGQSYVTRRPVAPDIWAAFGATLTYVALALQASVIYSALSAVVAYFRGSRVRRVIHGINSAFTSVPSLVVAIGLGVLVLALDLLAFIESADLRNTLTAALVLSVYPSCTLSQILIEESTRVRAAQYVTAGRSFGFSESRVFATFVMRNASLPWLAQLSNVAASLLAGSIVVEVVFSLPGIGRLLVQSVLRSDFPMMQGIVIVTSVTFLVLDFVAERLYRRLFPAQHGR